MATPTTDPMPTTTVELGPRSLALLRRAVFLLEIVAAVPGEDSEVKDPGPTFEDPTVDGTQTS